MLMARLIMLVVLQLYLNTLSGMQYHVFVKTCPSEACVRVFWPKRLDLTNLFETWSI